MTRILVVEDERHVAELLKAGLEDSGYQVSVAFDGEMGLHLQNILFYLLSSYGHFFVNSIGSIS